MMRPQRQIQIPKRYGKFKRVEVEGIMRMRNSSQHSKHTKFDCGSMVPDSGVATLLYFGCLRMRL